MKDHCNNNNKKKTKFLSWPFDLVGDRSLPVGKEIAGEIYQNGEEIAIRD